MQLVMSYEKGKAKYEYYTLDNDLLLVAKYVMDKLYAIHVREVVNNDISNDIKDVL